MRGVAIPAEQLKRTLPTRESPRSYTATPDGVTAPVPGSLGQAALRALQVAERATGIADDVAALERVLLGSRPEEAGKDLLGPPPEGSYVDRVSDATERTDSALSRILSSIQRIHGAL
jgi:hypothetical protein